MITPQEEVPELGKALGLNVPLYFKREDLHPYGSHKGRSIPYMIEQYARGGHTRFAVSSSGNAAIAAAMYINEYNARFLEQPLSLQIFVGEHINPAKLKLLRSIVSPAYPSPYPKGGAGEGLLKITQTSSPKQTVHMLDKRGEAKALRQSNDDLALVGYQSLVDELKQIGNTGAIFVPTSSGTTAQALAEGGLPVYVVQPASCHPIAEMFPTSSLSIAELRGASDEMLADAIVDKVALRKEKIKNLVKGGWIVNNKMIRETIGIVKASCDLEISPNSALSVAGLSKALKCGWQTNESIVCLITGR